MQCHGSYPILIPLQNLNFDQLDEKLAHPIKDRTGKKHDTTNLKTALINSKCSADFSLAPNENNIGNITPIVLSLLAGTQFGQRKV